MRNKNIIIAILAICLFATSSYIGVTLWRENNQKTKAADAAQNEEEPPKEQPEENQNGDNEVPEEGEGDPDYYEEIPQNEEESDQSPQQPEEDINVRSIKEMYEKLHKMANTLIIAEDDEIWGEEEITIEEVLALIGEVTASDYGDKEKLLEILRRWEQGDFSKGDQDHNYVWEKLEGDTGKAIGVKPQYQQVVNEDEDNQSTDENNQNTDENDQNP